MLKGLVQKTRSSGVIALNRAFRKISIINKKTAIGSRISDRSLLKSALIRYLTTNSLKATLRASEMHKVKNR
tara:strand:- start:710 stop:925 length:216 start_codon:yes stop_codon:yes gene_type:complete